MKYGVNSATFIGNLGRDPEIKYTADGTAVCNFSIAVTEKWKTGDHTEWINVVVWRKLAEICGEYLHKGSCVFLSGKIQTRSWDGDNGKQYRTELVVNEMRMLGGEQAAPKREQSKVDDPDDGCPF